MRSHVFPWPLTQLEKQWGGRGLLNTCHVKCMKGWLTDSRCVCVMLRYGLSSWVYVSTLVTYSVHWFRHSPSSCPPNQLLRSNFWRSHDHTNSKLCLKISLMSNPGKDPLLIYFDSEFYIWNMFDGLGCAILCENQTLDNSAYSTELKLHRLRQNYLL